MTDQTLWVGARLRVAHWEKVGKTTMEGLVKQIDLLYKLATRSTQQAHALATQLGQHEGKTDKDAAIQAAADLLERLAAQIEQGAAAK